MPQQQYKVLGLMSGTSLDGLDLCFAHFWYDSQNWQFKITQTETVSYTREWQLRLKDAHLLHSKDLAALDIAFGNLLAVMVSKFIADYKIRDIDFISSHGHTVLHQPANKITLQIGNGPQIMQQTNLPLVCDFRLQDVLLGGQGAPLVPIGDQLLFSGFTACVNLGGFANISYQIKNRVAFDICPVNIVLNPLAEMLGKPFDAFGEIANNGITNIDILQKLNALDFYTQAPPKSLGREWVEKNILPILKNDSPENLIATFTAHAAHQIVAVLKTLPAGQILFSGGGTFNTHLISLIKKELPKHKITIPNPELIGQKEALIFAFLGLLRWLNLPNCLASVTGASRNHSSGRIFLP